MTPFFHTSARNHHSTLERNIASNRFLTLWFQTVSRMRLNILSVFNHGYKKNAWIFIQNLKKKDWNTYTEHHKFGKVKIARKRPHLIQ